MKRAATMSVALAALAGSYLAIARPWHSRWGAADDEVERPLAGDELIPNPIVVTTRAITINAPIDEVWAWVVQIGERRGGFYSYDWVERFLGMEVQSTDRVLPEFQHLQVGDSVVPGPRPMVVKQIIEGRSLVLGPPTLPDYDSTWSFNLVPIGEQRMRLITRARVSWKWTPLNAVLAALIDPAAFLMERKMLLGIKERAERAAQVGLSID